jgi:hypothetical protein
VIPKKPYTLKIDVELLDAVRAIKEAQGIPESEQIRRGIVMWLASQGVTVTKKTGRKRAVTRRRP